MFVNTKPSQHQADDSFQTQLAICQVQETRIDFTEYISPFRFVLVR